MKISKSITRLATETAFKVFQRSIELEKKGNEIIHLSLGQPDFPTPNYIINAAKKALDEGYHGYTSSNGLLSLREQVAKDALKRFNEKVNPENILITPGGKPIIFFSILMFGEEGAEIIYPEPGFPIYKSVIDYVGAKAVPLFLEEKDNFEIDVNKMIGLINDKTRLIIINNPNNPTGTYLYKSELINLRKRLNSRILLVVDDAYSEYMKDKKYSSGLRIFENVKNVFILRTFSKVYGLASLRVGWGYGNKKIIDALNVIKPPFNVNRIAQLCAIESLKDKEFINKSVKHNFFWSKLIKDNLKKYSITTNKVSGNFLLLNFNKCKLSAGNIEKKLKKKGLILRETRTYGIKNCLRLTIGNNLENKLFLKAINGILKNV